MGSPKLITASERLSLFFRRVPAAPIRETRALLLRHSLNVPVSRLSAHARAGGDVREVGQALAEARLRHVPLDFLRACALDLARDRRDPTQRPVNIVRRAALPQELFFGAQGPVEFTQPGKFGWLVRLKARVRVNLESYIGGAAADLIEIRLLLALRLLYQDAPTAAAADAALEQWTLDPRNLRTLAGGSRLAVLCLERVE